jgi:aminopeptidase N
LNHIPNRRAARASAAAALTLLPLSAAIAGPPAGEAAILGCGKARALEARFLAGLGPAGSGLDDAGGGSSGGHTREAAGATDVLNNSIDIEIFPSTGTITGSNTMTIRSVADGLTEFTFRLRSSFTISVATINGATPVTITNLSTTTSKATLDRTYNTDETFTLRIDYTGVAVSRGFGSIDFTSQNGQPLVESLSEPYYAYTWWPCKDGDAFEPGDNADKATTQMSVTAPDTMVTISNGLLQGTDTLSGGRKRYRWATAYPTATYLNCFASTNYNTWTQTYSYPGGTMPVQFYIYPADDNATNRAAWNMCLTMLDTYRPIYGLYPFINEKYGIYEFNFGGGMEHQTMTGEGTFSETITSHELGHQWWGDNVTCRTWSDIWLNEGFATYTEALWLERKPGSTGLPALFSAMAARRPSTVNGSVYRTDLSSPNTIFSTDFSYRKGGWVLHQLRHVVGDQTFFDCLAAYRAAYQGSAATTDDFAAVCSSVSGQNLTPFFQEWVYGVGAPQYQYGWQTATINGQNYLRLAIRQVQTASYGLYTMPIDVRVDRSGGPSQTVTVRDNALLQYFVVPIPAPATAIALDEFNWILNTGKAAVAYTPGPAKLVQASPAPASTLPAGPTSATLTFSEAVNAAATSFTLTRSGGGGDVPFTFAYTPANFTATLSFAAPLAPGVYTITAAATITAIASGQALDGEVPGTTLGGAPTALPSGDGQPGGPAVYTFTIQGSSCPVDFNGDGVVNVADFLAYLAAYAAADPRADMNADGQVNVADFLVYLAAYAAGC